jgi:hypothetical protein
VHIFNGSASSDILIIFNFYSLGTFLGCTRQMHTRTTMKTTLTRRQLAAIVPGIVGSVVFPRSLRAQKLAPLKPPDKAGVPVAIMLSAKAVVMDFCGPISVFESVNIPSRTASAFDLYTVAETTAPVDVSGGLQIVPSYFPT